MIEWNTETIAWFKDASRYTGFHSRLAEMLRPHVAGCGTMQDLGCGLALLSQELHDSVGEIVCVDISEAALSSLQEDMEAKGIGSIRPTRGDCFEDESESDVILLSYFGSSAIDRLLPRCRRLIAIVDRSVASSLGGQALTGKDRKRQTADMVEEQLKKTAVRYSLQEIELEFGQPFRSRKDAGRFLQEYYHCTPEEAEAFIKDRVRPADQAPYEYYLPYRKRMGLFIIEGARR